MEAEAPPALGDVDERRHELGELEGEEGELVDDHEQAGQRLRRGEATVLVERGDAGLAQDPLAVAELGPEAAQHAPGEVLVEIGDEADGVRQVGAGVERGSALEVDRARRSARRGGG